MLLGYTQEQLADALEISYQQIQKYETGSNRVSAGRLFQIAQRLEAPISYFFEGLGLEFDAEVTGSSAPGVSNRTTIDVVRNLSHIPDAHVRAAISALVKALAASAPGVAQEDDAAEFDSLIEDGAGRRGSNGGRGNGGDHSPED